MLTRPRVGLAWALLTLLRPAASFGVDADAPRDLTLISLDELAQVKVTSVSKTEAPRFTTPAAIQVVTADDIRRAGVTNLGDVLRSAPGVHIARINSSQWAVGIRGFTSRLARSQLALMDGRSLYTPLFAGTYWDLQDTLLEDIDRIEIVRGPGGTLWGANAVNGIVNIVTKSAQDTQGTFVAAGGGTEERAFVRARYGGKLGSQGYYRVYGKYFDRDAGFHPDGDNYDRWHMSQGGFRSDWTLAAGGRLSLQGDAYQGREGERTNVNSLTPPFTRIVHRAAQLSGGNLTTHWDRDLGGSRLSVLAYYDRTRRAGASFQEVRDTFDFDVQDQVRAGGQELVFGVAYRISSGRTRGNDTVFFVPANRTDHIFSAFVQDQIAIVKDRLQLNVGSKLERNQYTGFQLQPSARLLWTPGSRQAVWAAVTRAVRTPSRVERDLQAIIPVSPTLYSKLLGDSGFENERMVAYEAGYRNRPTAWLSLDLAVFHNTFGDLLSTETGAPFAEGDRRIVPLRFANLLRGRTSGAELATEAHVSERWVVRAFYAYLNAHLEAKPGSTDTNSAAAAGASPRHNARVQSSWRLPHEVDLDLSLRWVGKLKPGAQAFQRVPSYVTLDARLAWPVFSHLELAIVGQDLVDAHHLEFLSGTPATSTEVQRSVYAEARWRW